MVVLLLRDGDSVDRHVGCGNAHNDRDHPYGDIIQTTKRRFATDGHEDWTQANTDQSGRIISEMRGRNTRRT